jgi:hypothetical protein
LPVLGIYTAPFGIAGRKFEPLVVGQWWCFGIGGSWRVWFFAPSCRDESHQASIFAPYVVATAKRSKEVPLNAGRRMGRHGFAYILGRDVVPAMLPGDFFQEVYGSWRWWWWGWLLGWHFGFLGQPLLLRMKMSTETGCTKQRWSKFVFVPV